MNWTSLKLRGSKLLRSMAGGRIRLLIPFVSKPKMKRVSDSRNRTGRRMPESASGQLMRKQRRMRRSGKGTEQRGIPSFSNDVLSACRDVQEAERIQPKDKLRTRVKTGKQSEPDSSPKTWIRLNTPELRNRCRERILYRKIRSADIWI